MVQVRVSVHSVIWCPFLGVGGTVARPGGIVQRDRGGGRDRYPSFARVIFKGHGCQIGRLYKQGAFM